MEIKVTVEAAPELMTAIDMLTAALVELIGDNKEKPNLPTARSPRTNRLTNQPTPWKPSGQSWPTFPKRKTEGGQSNHRELWGGKLTDIPAEHYPTVMALAAKLEAES